MVPTTRAYPGLKHVLWAQLPQGGPARETEMLFEDISSTATRDTVSITGKSPWQVWLVAGVSHHILKARMGALLLNLCLYFW